ncbi:tetratricopeptide repeat protein [Actinosynnema sp. NPDC023587]|uniref:tetratricopeptide repeat protein n=1 Tax=Actinosynnema sp. NPDC023587 TaxID=3154695 RepID=UPI0033C1D12F
MTGHPRQAPVTAASGSAVHRTIVVVDVEGFGDRQRTLPHQLGTRAGLYRVVERALRAAGVRLRDCHHEDRGDGLVVLVPPEVPKTPLVEVLPWALVAALREHNAAGPPEQRFRLRLAVHAGEVAFDHHGVTSTSLTTAFRLVDAAPLKQALADSPGTLALLVSRWVFDEVVRHSAVLDPATFRPVAVRVKEVRDTAWVALPDHPYPRTPAVLDRPTTDAGTIPRQLPAAPAPFIGRRDEADRIDRALDTGGAATVLISAIGGAGGIGKTWLALHWAHRHAERFPDGQLFVDLCGFSPTGEPMPSTEALRGFLDGLGVDPGRVPADLHSQAALYRSLVAGKRVLVVLDNAATVEQVAPLLPGDAGCAVVVTSRRRFDSLVTAHDAQYVDLGVLGGTEAHRLLSTRLTTTRIDSEPEAVDHLLDVCGGFPLALAIIAARARTRPDLPLAALSAELRDEATRLDALDSEDPAASLPTVLSWSLRGLPPPQREVFALLGIAPGPDIGVDAAASLVDRPAADTQQALRRLAQASLLIEDTPGRWRMHDLIRRYAAQRAAHELTEAERGAALRRTVDFYLREGATAVLQLHPLAHYAVMPIFVRPSAAPAAPSPATTRQAVDWFRSEYRNLAAAGQVALERGWHKHVWQLAWSMQGIRILLGRFAENVAVWRTVLTIADRLPGTGVTPWTHGCLGAALTWNGENAEAEHHLTLALEAAIRLGDVQNEAHAHFLLAWTLEQAGDDERVWEHATRCRQLSREAGLAQGEAYALHCLGRCHLRAGDHDEASACFALAVELHRAQDDRFGEAEMLDSLGRCTRLAGRPGAVEHHRRALELHRAHGFTRSEADCLDHLGHAHLADGDHDQARQVWREALDRYREQRRDDDADRVRQQLQELDGG